MYYGTVLSEVIKLGFYFTWRIRHVIMTRNVERHVMSTFSYSVSDISSTTRSTSDTTVNDSHHIHIWHAPVFC